MRLGYAVTVALMAWLCSPGSVGVAAVSPQTLAPALRTLPEGKLFAVFSFSDKPPSFAAELARFRALAKPTKHDTDVGPDLAAVMEKYPGTSDALRALTDLSGVYAKLGDWTTAEAPFRYVMGVRAGRPEGRIAHLRLIEFHRYQAAPEGSDVVAECRAAIEGYAGTPEEGMGRFILADVLAERGEYDEALREFRRLLEEFPDEPYTRFARVRYAYALVGAKQWQTAVEAAALAIQDRVWSGRAYRVRGEAYAGLGKNDQAIADYRKAAETADSVFIRADAYNQLGDLYNRLGQHAKAHACFEASAAADAFWNQPAAKLKSMQALLKSGKPLEAGQMAVTLRMQMTDRAQVYPAEVLAGAVRQCDEVLEQCEAALAGRSAPAGTEEQPGG